MTGKKFEEHFVPFELLSHCKRVCLWMWAQGITDTAQKASVSSGHKVWEVLVIKGSTYTPLESDSIKGIDSYDHSETLLGGDKRLALWDKREGYPGCFSAVLRVILQRASPWSHAAVTAIIIVVAVVDVSQVVQLQLQLSNFNVLLH